MPLRDDKMKRRTVVSDILQYTKGAGIYHRYPDISDRKKWDALSDNLKIELTEAGEKAVKEPWTQLLISDFTQFSKSGDRLAYEEKYFPRRRKLCALVMAECIENNGRFIPEILDGLYLILEESTWCLPAHNSYIRDAKQEYLPDVTRPIIDLFDAESGALVAMTEYLLRPVLDKISPYISRYVDERLNERIFVPYINEHFWWMGNGREPMCNWTSWCTQNVLICALTRREGFFDESGRRDFLERAAVSLDFFLDEYGDDGCCNEGAQYYSHAGLCLFGALELMSGALEDRGCSFDRVFEDPLIKNIGSYIVRMHACGDYYINFADCSPFCGRRTAREYLYGKRTGDKALSYFAASDFAKGGPDDRILTDEINLFYHVMQAFAYDEMMEISGKSAIDKSHEGEEKKAVKTGDELSAPSDSFFESTGLMIARDEHFVIAAKAGNNGDSHNHNDVGSFTVYKDRRPLIIDLGVGTYTAKTFSKERYEIWTMQSQFHNVPTFLAGNVEDLGKDPAADLYNKNVFMQREGAEFGAVSTKCALAIAGALYENESAVRTSSLEMDIAPAYGDDRIRSYKRKIECIKGTGVRVHDIYDGDLEAAVTLMLYEKPRLSGEVSKRCGSDRNEPLLIEVGELGKAVIKGAKKVKTEAFPIEDARLGAAWKHEVYRVLIYMDNDHELDISIS